MNKTIFNLSYKTSVIAISVFGILLAFLSNAFYVDNFIEWILYIFRFLLFIAIYGVFYLLEKENKEFKETNKRIMGYLIANGILNITFAIFSLTHILQSLFLTLSGITCFILIHLFVVEILQLFLNNKIINTMFEIQKKIGLFLASPIVMFIDRKITND